MDGSSAVCTREEKRQMPTTEHAWMLRASAISLCVGAQRLYLVLGEAVLPLLPPDWADTYRSHIKLIFVAHLYTGLLSTLFFTEVYGIGRTKKRKHA